MMNDEKIILAHLKRELILRNKNKTGGGRLLYPEEVLSMIAEIETNMILGWEDGELPWTQVEEST